MNFFKLISLSCLLSFSLLSFQQPLWANQRLGQGLQLSLSGNYQLKVHTEFIGQTLSLDDKDGINQVLIDVPELSKEDFGFAGRVGYKGKKWGIEFQYNQNQMKKFSSSLSDEHDVLTMTFYDLNGKHYFLQHDAIKSYLIFGLGYSTLSGNDLKQLSDLSLHHAQYRGLCYNLGVGLNLFINQSVFIFSDYIYRGLSYYQIDDQALKEALSHPLHAFYLGIGYAIGGNGAR